MRILRRDILILPFYVQSVDYVHATFSAASGVNPKILFLSNAWDEVNKVKCNNVGDHFSVRNVTKFKLSKFGVKHRAIFAEKKETDISFLSMRGRTTTPCWIRGRRIMWYRKTIWWWILNRDTDENDSTWYFSY